MLTVNALGLPYADRLHFPSSPLRLVICQVRFPPILTATTPDGVAVFQEAIRRDYPLLKPQDELAVVMAGSNLVHQQGTRIWRFEDVEQRWVAVLSDDFLAIETRHYDRFEELRDRFRTLVAAFRQIYSPV